MIIDWAEHCNKVYNTKTLSRDDPSDNKSHYKQEVIYLRFLREVKHYSDEECYCEWKKLTNGTAFEAREDNEATLRLLFHQIMGHSYVWYQQVDCANTLAPVSIFSSEVIFLNSLDVPLWVKQYWFTLLFYYKFAVQISAKVYKTPTLNAWCIRNTDYKDKRYGSKCQDKINSYQQEISDTIIRISSPVAGEKYGSYVPTFLQTTGDVVMVAASINDLSAALRLITPPVIVCTSCGTIFEKKPKSKRTMCDNCYKEWRRKYNRQFYTPKEVI